VEDGAELIDGILDNRVLGATDGIELGCTEGTLEGNVLGTDDGLVLGLSLIDGMEDGTILGTDDGQLPHVALHVWKKPTFLHFDLVAIAHVLSFFLK